jgi:hypothetical protein
MGRCSGSFSPGVQRCHCEAANLAIRHEDMSFGCKRAHAIDVTNITQFPQFKLHQRNPRSAEHCRCYFAISFVSAISFPFVPAMHLDRMAG